MSVHQVKDPADWLPTNVVRYPNINLFEEARNRGPQTRASFSGCSQTEERFGRAPALAPSQAWLNRAVTKIFGWLLEPEDPIKPAMVHGMDSYNIVLYLTMEILRVSSLLRVSTIIKEVGLCQYANLLDQVADPGPQQVGDARTTRTPNEAQVPQVSGTHISDAILNNLKRTLASLSQPQRCQLTHQRIYQGGRPS